MLHKLNLFRENIDIQIYIYCQFQLIFDIVFTHVVDFITWGSLCLHGNNQLNLLMDFWDSPYAVDIWVIIITIHKLCRNGLCTQAGSYVIKLLHCWLLIIIRRITIPVKGGKYIRTESTSPANGHRLTRILLTDRNMCNNEYGFTVWYSLYGINMYAVPLCLLWQNVNWRHVKS